MSVPVARLKPNLVFGPNDGIAQGHRPRVCGRLNFERLILLDILDVPAIVIALERDVNHLALLSGRCGQHRSR
jgi:hypothetical protein